MHNLRYALCYIWYNLTEAKCYVTVSTILNIGIYYSCNGSGKIVDMRKKGSTMLIDFIEGLLDWRWWSITLLMNRAFSCCRGRWLKISRQKKKSFSLTFSSLVVSLLPALFPVFSHFFFFVLSFSLFFL